MVELGLRARGTQLVELGDPRCWATARPGSMGLDEPAAQLAPVARTAAEGWLALYAIDGTLVGAVSRWCPHRGADLLEHARYATCPHALTCRHEGFSWSVASGELRSSGGPGPAAPLEIHPIGVRLDGTAFIDVEGEGSA